MAPSGSGGTRRATQAEVVGAAVRGGTGLMLVMVLQRGTNFVLNQLLLRHVDPAVFGIASIPLDLLLNTALFLSREGFRLALGRRTLAGVPSDSLEFRRFVNLSWLPALLGPLVSLLSLALLPAVADDDGGHDGGKGSGSSSSSSSSNMRGAMLLFCLAAALESLAEPAYLVCQGCLLTSLRAVSEGVATLARSALTFALLAWVLPPEQGLLAFGVAQVGYSLVLLAVYWGYLLRAASLPPGQRPPSLRLRALRHLFPGMPYHHAAAATSTKTAKAKASATATAAGAGTAEGWVDPGELRLAGALTGQSLFKHLLTQGDKIVLAFGSSHYSQGLYALAQNYGSLAARLLFQPLEESGRLMFARLAAAAAAEEGEDEGEEGAGEEEDEEDEKETAKASSASSATPARNRKKMGKKAREAEREAKAAPRLTILASSRTTLGLMLGALVKLVVLAGLVFACFGFNYTRVLLRLLLPGKRWQEHDASSTSHDSSGGSASTVLSWYCLYVLLLAVNGMTEAFVYAAAQPHEVTALSLSAGAAFALFAAATLPLMRAYGTVGLVLANSLGMAARCLFSLAFIRRFFARARQPLPDLFPSPIVGAAFVAAFAGTLASDSGTDVGDWGQVAMHVGFGALAFAGVAATVVMAEQDWLADLRGIRRLAKGEAAAVEGGGGANTITIETAGAEGGSSRSSSRSSRKSKGRKAE